jgi:hypothetical protein
MPRVFLDLNSEEDRQVIKAKWRLGRGLVPGQPNEGLVSELPSIDARQKDFDDSSWEEWPDIRRSISGGLTFAWFRLTLELPAIVKGMDIAGSRLFFETNVDNYGETWIDGSMDRGSGAIGGINITRRIEIGPAQPGESHTIACLVANGPLAEPRGGVFIRYATLAFETPE